MPTESPEARRTDPKTAPTLRAGARGWTAAIALVILIGSGAAAGDSAFPYDQGGSGSPQARLAVRVLQPTVAAAGLSQGGAESADALRELIRSAREGGLDPRGVLKATFPNAAAILAMLSLDRDIEDFSQNASRGGAGGAYYGNEARLAQSIRSRRQAFFSVFDAAAGELGLGTLASPGSGVRPYRSSTGITRPPRSDLASSHPYALDLFFARVRHRADGQEGPPIPSLSDGIVVAAADNWKGGAGLQSWIEGGLSPSAGNGVVVYDAANRRVFSYFHLRSTSVGVGDIVRAGSQLGIGGNTGVNARRPGHGGHLHVEIFDAARDRPLNSYELLDLVTAR